jgi:hypothetical protein
MAQLATARRTGPTPATLQRLRSVFSGAVLAVVVVVGLLGAVGVTASASTDPKDDVVTCLSGVVSRDGIDTSSASAAWVPAGVAVADGCRKG